MSPSTDPRSPDPAPSTGPASGPHTDRPGRAAASVWPVEELRAQYAAYRRRQARALLSVIPGEAIRPLYREALSVSAEGLPGGGAPDDVAEVEDPMEILVTYCEKVLPLPPFQVWLDDMQRRPEAHWLDLEGSAEAPTAARPVTIDARSFGRDPDVWTGRLRGFRDGNVWRGFITFGAEREREGVHRTALIFCESSVSDLRDRFRGFDEASLKAFLRSALP